MGEAEEPRLGDKEGELERELVGVAACEAVGDAVREAVVVIVIEGDCERDVLCDGEEERVTASASAIECQTASPMVPRRRRCESRRCSGPPAGGGKRRGRRKFRAKRNEGHNAP